MTVTSPVAVALVRSTEQTTGSDELGEFLEVDLASGVGAIGPPNVRCSLLIYGDGAVLSAVWIKATSEPERSPERPKRPLATR